MTRFFENLLSLEMCRDNMVSFYVKSFLNIMLMFSISGLYSNQYGYVNIACVVVKTSKPCQWFLPLFFVLNKYICLVLKYEVICAFTLVVSSIATKWLNLFSYDLWHISSKFLPDSSNPYIKLAHTHATLVVHACVWFVWTNKNACKWNLWAGSRN